MVSRAASSVSTIAPLSEIPAEIPVEIPVTSQEQKKASSLKRYRPRRQRRGQYCRGVGDNPRLCRSIFAGSVACETTVESQSQAGEVGGRVETSQGQSRKELARDGEVWRAGDNLEKKDVWLGAADCGEEVCTLYVVLRTLQVVVVCLDVDTATDCPPNPDPDS